ncbi:MAG: aldehyde dehydrogenase family protein [Deltaproteobacteria bacterium]|nr:aldehyde dehydrogenase family protein [Deltaproteobacteria bacterium]
MTAPDINFLTAQAKKAWPQWRALSFKERGKQLKRFQRLFSSQIDDVCKLMSSENGKPRFEALTAEVLSVIQLINWAVKKAPKILKKRKIKLALLKYKKSYLYFEPLGTVGIISPWNYPLSIPLGEAIMAMMAGNCVIVKPSEVTPLIMKKVAKLFEEAGLPSGVFQLALGGGDVGQALVNSPYVDKIIFTGSVATGKKILKQAADTLKPVVLELGGCDPMLVCSDADVERAANGAVWGCFMNAGQTCASVERVYVHHHIADSFIEKVVEKTKKLRVGKDVAFDVDVGAITYPPQFKIYESQMQDAIFKGAKILEGQTSFHPPFVKPTVLLGTNDSMKIIQDETFGPFLCIQVVYDEEEAVRLANENQYGLCASVWSRNLKKARHLAQDLEAGTVVINDCSFTHALSETPWGGRKMSGMGRVHSEFGFYELVHIKHVNEDRGWFKPLWWYPYSERKYKLFKFLAKLLTLK